MQTSRDDFIIAIRSVFLKKGTKQRFSLIGLIFFSIFLIVLEKFNFTSISYLQKGINEVVYRSSFIVSVPEKYFTYSLKEIKNHINVYKNYKLIKKKLDNQESEKYNIDFIISENQRLKKTLEDINYSSEEIFAKVLIDKKSPFLRSIIVNKGTNNEIKKGMAVLNNNYLVGKVIEVNFGTSRVLLLSDLNSKIPVVVEPGSILSILSGTGTTSGEIQYSKTDLSFEENNIVYTSGTGGLFNAGIPIGKIVILDDKTTVKFFSDFSQLRYVTIKSFFKDLN